MNNFENQSFRKKIFWLNLQNFEHLLIHLVSLVLLMLEMLPKNSNTFWDFLMLQNFLFATSEGSVINSNKQGIYELPRELLKELRN